MAEIAATVAAAGIGSIEIAGAGPDLLAVHLADSTRLGLGHGSLDLASLVSAGPYVLEFTAPGPRLFEADKGPAAMRLLDTYVSESSRALDRL